MFDSAPPAEPPAPPEVDRPPWTCPGCGGCYDGRPAVAESDPLRCFCSDECRAEFYEGR